MKKYLTILFVSTMVAGCANTDIYSSDVYSGSQAKQVQSVSYGTLVSARPVKIQAGNETGNVIGTVGGAVLGGFLGNTIGGGSGRSLATAAGAVLGGVAGNKIEDKVNLTNAYELEIRKDDGNTIIVVQKADNSQFSAGQRVRIVSSGSKTTVSPQ